MPRDRVINRVLYLFFRRLFRGILLIRFLVGILLILGDLFSVSSFSKFNKLVIVPLLIFL